MIALSTDSGAELWRTESPSVAPLSLPPKLVDHVVVVTETGSRIAAFDLETGRSLWRTAAISVSGLYSPKIDDLVSAQGFIIVARHDWSLTAYSAASGEVAWEHRIANRAAQYLVSDGRLVYLAVADVLDAYDVSSGALLWERKFDGYVGPMLLARSVLYVMNQATPSLIALTAESRRVLWQVSFEDLRPFEASCLVEAPGYILIAERKVIAVSESDGKLEWGTVQTGPLECPVTFGGNLYVRNREHTLYAFDIMSGVQSGSFPVESNTPLKNEPGRGPIVSDGLLITASESREVVALRP